MPFSSWFTFGISTEYVPIAGVSNRARLHHQKKKELQVKFSDREVCVELIVDSPEHSSLGRRGRFRKGDSFQIRKKNSKKKRLAQYQHRGASRTAQRSRPGCGMNHRSWHARAYITGV